MSAEISEVFFELDEGDSVHIVHNEDSFEGEVRTVRGDPREPGTYTVFVGETSEGRTLKLRCRIQPAEPNVGIRDPYPEDGGAPMLYIDGDSRGLVDELTKR